jgi:DNA replication and repair protein RecF
VQVSHLSLRDFRSYAELEIDLPAGPQVVVGPNAAGKTNLLEALVVLAQGHSHRTSTDAELIRWGAGFARVEAAVSSSPPGPTGSDQLEVVLVGAGSPGARKRVRVNGVPRRPSALASALRAVLFAPEDMLLVVGSPGLRRAVLDELVVQRTPAAGGSMSMFARALTQRNNLLRRIRDEVAAPDELGYWNEVVCVEGGRIVTWRLETLDALAGPLESAHAEIAPTETPLSLRYLSNAAPGAGEDAEEALRRRPVS